MATVTTPEHVETQAQHTAIESPVRSAPRRISVDGNAVGIIGIAVGVFSLTLVDFTHLSNRIENLDAKIGNLDTKIERVATDLRTEIKDVGLRKESGLERVFSKKLKENFVEVFVTVVKAEFTVH